MWATAGLTKPSVLFRRLRVLCLLLLLLLLSEAEQLSLGSASANFCVAKAKRGLQEAEQLRPTRTLRARVASMQSERLMLVSAQLLVGPVWPLLRKS
jgi:hypothetical protein